MPRPPRPPRPVQVGLPADNCKEAHDDTCSICYEELAGAHTRLDCGHCYHHACCKDWVTEKRSCPKCRAFVENKRIIVTPPTPRAKRWLPAPASP